MNNNCFCHLHNHMEFSQLDGFGTAKDHIKRAKELGLDALKFLNNNDSYNFFNKLEDLIITGSTNTNVMDVQIILIG